MKSMTSRSLSLPITGFIISLFFSLPTHAAEINTPKDNNHNQSMNPMNKSDTHSSNRDSLVSTHEEVRSRMLLRGGAIIGKDVIATNGETLGEIVELALTNEGKISDVIVSVGGFMGMGDRLVVLPWNSLTLSPTDTKITTNLTKAQVVQAPAFGKVADSDNLQLQLKEPQKDGRIDD